MGYPKTTRKSRYITLMGLYTVLSVALIMVIPTALAKDSKPSDSSATHLGPDAELPDTVEISDKVIQINREQIRNLASEKSIDSREDDKAEVTSDPQKVEIWQYE